MCRWCVTYCWKALNEGYNFSLDLTSIRGLHTELWASKVAKVPISRILRLQLGSPETKWHLGASSVARHREKYKGRRWWLLPSLGRGESCEFVFARGSSVHQKCSNYMLTNLLFGLCRSMWIIELLVALPSPHPIIPARRSTPKCRKPGSVPQLLILPLFSP